MCNCKNCQTEGYFEYVRGYIPDDCKFKTIVKSDDPVTSYDSQPHTFDNIV